MRRDKSSSRPMIAHSVRNWLPLTATWIYHQIKHLEQLDNVVLAECVQNLDAFPWSRLVYPQKCQSYLYQRAILGAQLLGIRWHPAVFQQAIARYQPVILHSHFGDKGWYDMPLARKHKLRQVVTYYGYDVSRLPARRPFWVGRYQQLFAQADLFLCEGAYMANQLHQLGCPDDKIRVHRLGIELNRFPFVPRISHEGEPLRILIAGSFREKKGIPYALEAVGRVSQQFPALQVTIIGDAGRQKRELEEKQKILDTIERYRLRPIVSLRGYQPYDTLINEAYKHHIFLSPSVKAVDGDTEGGAPVSIIEMAASGMPIVSTTHCDIPNIVHHGVSGLLVEERDVDALVDALFTLIHNRQLITEMGHAGRTFVEEHHDAHLQADKLYNLYMQLV